MIKWLVAGTGQAGRCHLAAIKRTEGAALAAIVDPFYAGAGEAPVFKNITSALQAVDADAVVIASPNDTQADLASAALGSGLPVLCEKPIGTSLAQAQALVTQAATAAVPLGVVLNQRAQSHSRWICDTLQSGALVPEKVTFTGDLARLTGWHADPERSGGGILRTIGLHYIDLLSWWLGPPADVQAELSGEPQEDSIKVDFKYTSDCTASIDIVAVKEAATGPVRCVIEGQGGAIDMTGHVITSVSGLPKPPPAEPADTDFFFGPGHLAVIGEATTALSQGMNFPVPLPEILPSLAVIEEIYATSGR